MILHAWTEVGGRMRVRITETTDVRSGSRTVAYAASPAEVVAAVKTWLESVVTVG